LPPGLAGRRRVLRGLRLTGGKLLRYVCPQAVIVQQDAAQQPREAVVINRYCRPLWLWVKNSDPDLVPASRQRRRRLDPVDLYPGVGIDAREVVL